MALVAEEEPHASSRDPKDRARLAIGRRKTRIPCGENRASGGGGNAKRAVMMVRRETARRWRGVVRARLAGGNSGAIRGLRRDRRSRQQKLRQQGEPA
jgi:hypothetical protein